MLAATFPNEKLMDGYFFQQYTDWLIQHMVNNYKYGHSFHGRRHWDSCLHESYLLPVMWLETHAATLVKLQTKDGKCYWFFLINIFRNIAVLDVSRTGRAQSVFQHPVALSSCDFSGGTRAPRFIDIQDQKKKGTFEWQVRFLVRAASDSLFPLLKM